MYRLILGTYLLFMVTMLMRCEPVTEVSELVKQTERIQVVFNTNLGDYTDITSKQQIRKFKSYITDEPTPIYECGYDGYLLFFTEAGSVRMDFNLMDDCQHVIYDYGQSIETRKLSDEGLEYLRSIAP
jgi:hypothetical protein